SNTPLNENCSTIILKKLPERLRDPGKFLIPCGFSELKCKALANLGVSISLLPLLVWKKLGLPELISTRMTLELANRAICTPAGIARDVFVLVGKLTFPADFVIIDYESDPRVPLILGRPFLRTARALINVHGEEMILHDGEERIVCNKSSKWQSHFSSHTDLTSPEVINPLSGNPTPISEPVTKSSSSPTLTSFEESDLIWEEFEAYLASDLFPPGNDDPVDLLLEEFTDELALITFPSGNDDLPFDIESGLREIEYLINDDPTKEMDTILEDSEDKIKESKLLIDELDPPRSSDFLPSPKIDSVLYEDFSEVDVLPSTNNEDKVFNPGMLIYENLFEVTIRVTPDKNVKKLSSSNDSLILEDFNPPLYELPSTKKFPGLKFYSRFHPKMRKKFLTPGFSLLKEFILLFSQNYLIGTLKLSKSLKILKARWRFFLALMERTSVFWMFRVSISIPLDQLKYGGRDKLSDLKQAFREIARILKPLVLVVLSFIHSSFKSSASLWESNI
ncbi:reverse transcriptase domain-containing protein, partial [Tanacetum coccineum]